MTVPALLILDTARCTACRACALACHDHHTGRFGMERASVHIEYDAGTSALEIRFDESCDQCANEDGPLCARFCAPGAIQARPDAAGMPSAHAKMDEHRDE